MASLLDDKPFMIELNGLHFGPSKKVVGSKILLKVSYISNWPKPCGQTLALAKDQLSAKLEFLND